MRLIDADALWQEVISHTYSVAILENEHKVLNEVLKMIDHAQSFDLDDFYGKAFRNGEENTLKIRGLNERPQGEWIGKEEYDDYPNKTVCECSECGKMICVSHNDFPNFCENCGAKMQKGSAQ